MEAAATAAAIKAAIVLIPCLCKTIASLIGRLQSKERPLMRLLQLCAIAKQLSTLKLEQSTDTALADIARVLAEVKSHLEGVEKDPKIKKKWQGWRKRSVVERYVENLEKLIFGDVIKLQRLKNIPTPPLWNRFISQPALVNWLSKVPLFSKDFEESTASFERALKTALPKGPKLVSDFVAKLSRDSDTISIELLAALNQFQEEKDLESLMKTLIAYRGGIMEWMCMVCEYEHNTADACAVCHHVKGKSRIKLTLFLGNLGAGKSALANLLLLEYSLRFGSEYKAESVTRRFEFAPGKDGWFIGDTPGLDENAAKDEDIQRIALQIELALSDSVDLHRLCFVIYPRGGRLAPVDVWTLKAIMRALGADAPKYYLIVNQVRPDCDTSQFHAELLNKLMVALAEGEPLEPPQDTLFIPACQSVEHLLATQQARLMAFVNRMSGQPLLANRESQPYIQFQGQMPTVIDRPNQYQIAHALEVENEAKQRAEQERSKNEKRAHKLNINLKNSLANIVKRERADDPRVVAATELLVELGNEGIPSQGICISLSRLQKFQWKDIVFAVLLCVVAPLGFALGWGVRGIF